ncbi:MAG TPA: hypothetical protein VG826_18510 [Pirellulales bacterium]|nr:hypothetical protein [Pirellulales bacterium]
MTVDEDDGWEDVEYGDADDDAELVRCPLCGEEIFEDAEQCPYCGDCVVHSTSPFSGRPVWFCVFGLLGVVATVAYLLM